MNTKLLKRVASACVIGPAFLGVLAYGGIPFIAVMIVCFVLCCWEWISISKQTNKPFFLSIIGILYFASAFLNFSLLRISSQEWFGIEWYYLIIPLLFGVWSSDIGGYVAGRTYGEIRPFPRISPNKTWAGFYGAVLTPAILLTIGAITLSVLHDQYMIFGYIVAFILGALIGALGQVGDLLVSCVKRMADVKDTGSIIPGHGGLLDRVDSLLLVTLLYPTFLIFLVTVFGS